MYIVDSQENKYKFYYLKRWNNNPLEYKHDFEGLTLLNFNSFKNPIILF